MHGADWTLSHVNQVATQAATSVNLDSFFALFVLFLSCSLVIHCVIHTFIEHVLWQYDIHSLKDSGTLDA